MAKIEFGDDAWGKWATGVQERLDKAEKALAANDGSAGKAFADRLDKVEKALAAASAKGGKADKASGGGDMEVRMRALEMLSGIAQNAGKDEAEAAAPEAPADE